MPAERLQKILARAGIAARRRAEEIITAGRVRVNGRVVDTLGAKADPRTDKIEVDGRAIAAEHPVTLVINKPRGVVCTARDPEGRETVLDLVRGLGGRLFTVGRLDFATSGALLITNDGELAQALTHPKHGVEKTYLVKVRGPVGEDVLAAWRRGVDIGDVVTRPALVHRVEEENGYTWLEVTIREGRNRQLRRMAEVTGIDVQKLKRIRFAGIGIEGLKVGEYREITARELALLKRDYVNPARGSKDASPDAGEEETETRPKKAGRRAEFFRGAPRARGKPAGK